MKLEQLRADGQLRTKVGGRPVVVFWHDEQPWAIEDRCPHLGFPLHQGTVESGMVTCHWHHARFDLASGCTLDPWADDATIFDTVVDGDEVIVSERPVADRAARQRARLRDGLEHGISLVMAKAVLALAEMAPAGSRAWERDVVEEAARFGLANRSGGWGSGLTTLVALANVADHLDGADRPLALIHGLVFLAGDTRGNPPRFAEQPLDAAGQPADRLAQWYRRFVETRAADAAEKALATEVVVRGSSSAEAMMFAAVTDHVFIDEGHALDFTNKAFEAIERLGEPIAEDCLTSLVAQTCAADRSEESSQWRHPVDLVSLIDDAVLAHGDTNVATSPGRWDGASVLAWRIIDGEPKQILDDLVDALRSGAAPEQVARAVAYAAALRITRFHTQNDHGDWDSVHHGFTTANALHQALIRRPTPELMRGLFHSALRVHLDRFLNIPAARRPTASSGDLADLAPCWDRQGDVDAAGSIVFGFLAAGGVRADAIAALGRALLHEDAGFHWYQVVEAGCRQAMAWPEGSEESALILVGVARFLAAHTPTRRELPRVVEIAARLRRGDAMYEEAG